MCQQELQYFAYVCPGRLPLVETFKAGKKLLKEGKR